MSAHRGPRTDDVLELVPLKSALVNNNCSRDEEEGYYTPAPVHSNPSSSNLYDYTLLSKRTPASKRLLSKNTHQPSPTPLVTLCGAPPPSRKREELATMANLRKKVAPALLRSDKKNFKNDNEPSKVERENEKLDNRPKLLQKVIPIWQAEE